MKEMREAAEGFVRAFGAGHAHAIEAQDLCVEFWESDSSSDSSSDSDYSEEEEEQEEEEPRRKRPRDEPAEDPPAKRR